MARFSDLRAPGSIDYPRRIDGLPCECNAGFGEKQDGKGKISCVECGAGQFSHGGELIDTWKKWNGTNGVPGSGYNAYPYCSDFLTGKDCESWKPGGRLVLIFWWSFILSHLKKRLNSMPIFIGRV